MSNLNWQHSGGWYGGTVFDVASSGGAALATTLAGVYRSTNDGQMWHFCSHDIVDSAVQVLAAADDGATVYAATQNKRLFESTNSGQTWREVLAWDGVGVINALALAPNFADSGTLFAATNDGVYRSFDRGESWQLGDFGLIDSEILCLAVAPNFADSELLWAGSASGGLYRSPNAARAWRESGNGLPDSAVQCVAVSRHFVADKTLFAGMEEGGLYVSRNGGTSWESAGLTQQVIHCLSVAADGSVWAGTGEGIFVLDAALKPLWGAALLAAGTDAVLALTHIDGQRGLAGLWEAGIVVTHDAGVTWQAANYGLAAQIPPQMCQLPNGAIYCLSSQALGRSDDNGQTWQVLKRQDSMGTESILSNLTPLLYGDEQGVVVSSPTRLEYFDLLGVYDRSGYTPQPPLSEGVQRAMGCIARQAQVSSALAVVYLSKDLHVSADAGKTWHSAPGPNDDGTPLQAEITQDGAIHIITYVAMTGDEAEADETGVVTYIGRVWRWEAPPQTNALPQTSDDWTLLTTLNGLHVPLVSLVSSDDALMIGAQNSITRVGRGADGVLQADIFEFDEAINVTGMARSPRFADDHTLLAATNRGVYASLDEGVSWQIYGEALVGRSVMSLLTHRKILGAVTLGGEIWRM